MRTIILVFVACLALHSLAIPYKEQIALLNSLEVGRKEADPMTWQCTGCEDWNKPIRSHEIKEDVQDVRAILSVYDQYTVLAFRYTATIKNVWYDLLWAFQVNDEHAPQGCKVQKKFDNMWNSIRTQVLDDLRASSHTGRLIITGISLGGGLSMLSYVDIKAAEIFDNIEIITYGAPRVGNKNWAKWMETITEPDPVHICIKGDPICILPRCLTPICNYRHSGTGYSCNKKTQTCSPTGKLGEEEEELTLGDIDYAELVANVEDHFVNEKIEDGQVDGIIDHIYGYKKLRDWAWVAQK